MTFKSLPQLARQAVKKRLLYVIYISYILLDYLCIKLVNVDFCDLFDLIIYQDSVM